MCPELEGGAWFSSLLFFAHELFRLSFSLLPVILDSLVVQQDPTLLFAFVLSEGFPLTLPSWFSDDPVTAELIALPIRPSSAKVYQSQWIEFPAFLRREGVVLFSQCTLRHAVKFLTLLFTEKGLLASTVAYYHAALSVPLRTVLDIDILDPAVSVMLRATSLRRPSHPLAAPSWNLQRVLDYLEGLPAHIAYDDALARAAFLVLLCTGWHISEL